RGTRWVPARCLSSVDRIGDSLEFRMRTNTWKYLRLGASAAVSVAALVACNSHLLINSGDPDVPPPPPPTETLVCPSGQVRVHVRDLWSSKVTPTMNTMTDPPIGVMVIDPTGSYQKYGARLDGKTDIDGNPPCTFYSVCIPNTVTKIQIQ